MLKQKTLHFLSFFALFIALILPVSVKAETPVISTVAKQALIVDAQTGSVVFEKNSMDQMPTSSMSKVMTMLVIFDALKDGRLKLDDTLLVSKKAWAKGGSKMFVGEGTRISVEDLIKGVIVQSGNDACIVLAEGLAGSEEAFVDLINQKARELGMNDSNFKNSTGWPDPDHYSTARDLMKMSLDLVYNYPEFYHYYSIKEFEHNGIKQNNRNPLLYRNLGADGIKTGHTDVAGYGLIGSAEQAGRRIFMVLNGLETDKMRRSESARLLAWIYNNTENVTIAKKDDVIYNAKVWMGSEKTIPLVLNEDFHATIYNDSKDQIKTEILIEEPLQAPVAFGAEVAKLRVTLPDNTVIEKPLFAATHSPEMNIFGKALARIEYAVVGLN